MEFIKNCGVMRKKSKPEQLIVDNMTKDDIKGKSGQSALYGSKEEKNYFDNFQELAALRIAIYRNFSWWPQNTFLPERLRHLAPVLPLQPLQPAAVTSCHAKSVGATPCHVKNQHNVTDPGVLRDITPQKYVTSQGTVYHVTDQQQPNRRASHADVINLKKEKSQSKRSHFLTSQDTSQNTAPEDLSLASKNRSGISQNDNRLLNNSLPNFLDEDFVKRELLSRTQPSTPGLPVSHTASPHQSVAETMKKEFVTQWLNQMPLHPLHPLLHSTPVPSPFKTSPHHTTGPPQSSSHGVMNLELLSPPDRKPSAYM